MATPGAKTRILVVDDSAVMRSLLRTVIGTDADLELAGVAADGESALGLIRSARPDLVILDVEMPVMDGLTTLRAMRARNLRPPVIMCSSLTRRGAAVTVEALAAGAADYVTKPAGQANLTQAIRTLAQDLLPKVHALTRKRNVTQLLPPIVRPADSLTPEPVGNAPSVSATPTVVVMGVSTGGPAALDMILPRLPAQLPLPVLIVQHMPEMFTQLLAERLDRSCKLQVVEAAEGRIVAPGTVVIARGNWHMEVLHPRAGQAPALHLSQTPLQNHCRPSVDVLFRSAAAVYGAGVLGVVLTGMGSDGLEGARAILRQGGTILAQDEATSAVWGMPGAVVRAGLAQRVLPLELVAAEMIRLAGRTNREASGLREAKVS
ncbi:MAG: chemotaxis response regulator protein-glutamate methylesterase [Terracidiphilus sp.]|nr:chemotaxis response regulator protein-glutamate methylesterase [Terracidiphilus sp.]